MGGVFDQWLALRIACFIGTCDSVVALIAALTTRPHPVSIVLGTLWILAWGTALWKAAALGPILRARPWVLVALAPLAMAPAAFDGGYPGTLATQPVWLVLVAAATTSAWLTIATAASLFAAKLGVFAVTESGPEPLGEGAPSEARTALLMPLLLAPLALGLAPLVQRIRPRERPVGTPVASRELTRAEADVVALLAAGLTPKEIAHRRGTSLATVRTQIKNAKRASGARTLDELVAKCGVGAPA